MNEENESSSKLAQESLLYIAIASRHPFIALAMREGWLGTKAKEVAEWNETRVMSKAAMWKLVLDFTAQLEEDEWEERRQNASDQDIDKLKEIVIKCDKAIAKDKEYWAQWKKDINKDIP